MRGIGYRAFLSEDKKFLNFKKANPLMNFQQNIIAHHFSGNLLKNENNTVSIIENNTDAENHKLGNTATIVYFPFPRFTHEDDKRVCRRKR